MVDAFTIESGLILLSLFGAFVFRWGFRNLPGEGWQVALAVPARTSSAEGRFWSAINFTFYGVIAAIAYALACLVFLFLIGATAQPMFAAIFFAGTLLTVAIPASKWVNRLVEGIPGHTIGGAVFAVMLSVIPAITLTGWVVRGLGAQSFSPLILIAATSVAYVLGEAIGRLACLSFGCCYGKPIDDCTMLQRALYSRLTETYRGQFKKISYASGLANRPVVAVQSIGCCILFGLFLAALWAFWKGSYAASIVIAIAGSQLWRAYSELLRADFRGRAGFTIYQGMALFGASLSFVFASLYADANIVSASASAIRGWDAVLRVEFLIGCQTLALLIMFYMGRSSVTSSRIELFLHAPRRN